MDTFPRSVKRKVEGGLVVRFAITYDSMVVVLDLNPPTS